MKITIEDADANTVRQLLNGLSLPQGVVRTAPHSERGDIADMVLRALDLPKTINNLAVRDALYRVVSEASAFRRLHDQFAGEWVNGSTLEALERLMIVLSRPADTRALDATGAYMVGLAKLMEDMADRHGPSATRRFLTEHAETLRRRGEALVSIPTAEAP